MNFKNIFLALTVIFSLCSCAVVYTDPILPMQMNEEDLLFSQAEKNFQAKAYKKALELYNQYLTQFPHGSVSDAALMKMGTIYTAIKSNVNALASYKRLIDEYPNSSFVFGAKIEILAIMQNEGRYDETINQATEMLESADSRIHILRLYIILGNAYMANGFPKDAINFYVAAYKKAKDIEKEAVIEKIENILAKFETSIAPILDGMDDKTLVNHLMRRLDKTTKKQEIHSEKIPLKLEDDGSVTIGCLLPLTGQFEVFGNKALRGVELALSRFSSQNFNRNIKIIIKDTGSDSTQATLSVQELAQAGVSSIIGPVWTAKAAAIEAQRLGIPIVAITQQDGIADIGDCVFRNFFTPEMQVETIVSYAVNKLEISNFAILYPDEKYGKTFMNLFWDKVIAYGGKIVGVESYDLEQTDFEEAIKKLVGLYYDNNEQNEDDEPEPVIDFDAIFIPDSPKRAGLIMPQLAFHDIEDVYVFGSNLWHSDTLIKMARKYVQGALMPDIFFAKSSSYNVRKFVKFFQNTFGEKPEFIEAAAYDTAMILFQTTLNAKFTDDIKNNLLNLIDFQGVTGLTSFDDNGEVQKKLHLLKIIGSRFFEIDF